MTTTSMVDANFSSIASVTLDDGYRPTPQREMGELHLHDGVNLLFMGQ